jgi:transcriptional regulator with GAF, ATPase, and Fis domain
VVTAVAEALALAADLADAVAGATTRKAIARRAAEAFSRHLPFRWLELGSCDAKAGRARVVVVEVAPGAPIEPLESARRLAGSAAQGVVRRRKAFVAGALRDRDPDGHSSFPEEETAASLGCDHLAILPLVDAEGDPGYAAIGAAEGPGASLLRGEALEAVAKILLVATRQGQILERVARLSSKAHRENEALRRELARRQAPDAIVARSEVMRRVLERVDLVAGHDTTVLLRGESGTGKELLARRLHALSARASRPLIVVNCGALPENLVESELFGHEKGAFTGADRRHVGRFERAHGGTIFLDEVAELPLAAQVKLLRVLEAGDLEPVGGEETRKVDVRVIAATHRPLEEMVEAGTFRADLFYRLDVFPVAIPPLRERQEDVLALVPVLLAAIAARLGCRVPKLQAGTLDRLAEQPWPGNVRELTNALERALILSPGETLELPRSAPAPAHGARGRVETLAEGTRRLIGRALAASRGQIYGKAGAAALLGLKPSTLQGKMRRLGMKRQDHDAPP